MRRAPLDRLDREQSKDRRALELRSPASNLTINSPCPLRVPRRCSTFAFGNYPSTLALDVERAFLSLEHIQQRDK